MSPVLLESSSLTVVRFTELIRCSQAFRAGKWLSMAAFTGDFVRLDHACHLTTVFNIGIFLMVDLTVVLSKLLCALIII